MSYIRGVCVMFWNQRYQGRLFLLVLTLFFGFSVAAPAAAFTITTIAVEPNGALVSGTPVVTHAQIDFQPSGGETFPETNELQFSTDLDNSRWNYTIILDGVESPQPGSGGRTLNISGWILSYPSTVQESLNITLEGTAPNVSSPASRTIITITEFDSGNNPITGSRFSRTALIYPSPTITFNENLTITPGTTVTILVGGTVVWVNNDPLKPHGIRALSSQTAQFFGGMDTITIPYGTPFNVTFDRKGTYNYTTVFQPAKIGKITVTPATITLMVPNGGANWNLGSIHTITWKYTGSPGSNVKIVLLRGTAVKRVINASTSIGSGGLGSSSWKISYNQSLGTDFKVRISSTTHSAYSDMSNTNFTISAGAPITVTIPNGGANWKQESHHTITWSYTGNPGSKVKIELLKGTAVNSVINASTSIGFAGSGSYSWKIPSAQTVGTDYKIRITSISNPAFTDKSNANFTISAS